MVDSKMIYLRGQKKNEANRALATDIPSLGEQTRTDGSFRSVGTLADHG